jgi:transketolase
MFSSTTLPETTLSDCAHALRFLSIDAVEKAKSGHPGMPLGMADVITVLFHKFLTFHPANPTWANRDRFVLSAGHGSMLLYSALCLCDYPGMSIDELKNFRQWGSLTPGHPEYGHTPGIETTTGPLGQGIATAVGLALGESIMSSRLGNDIIDHKTYVMCGDGDLMEGVSQEAISLAGHLNLKNLIVLFDDNGITIDGKTDLSTRDDPLMRFKASGWHVRAVDGHNLDDIQKALTWAQTNDAPTLLACKTTIGFGAPTKANTSSCHGSPLGMDEIMHTREALKWSYDPFDIPPPIRYAWMAAANRHKVTYELWQSNLRLLPADRKALIEQQEQTFNPDMLSTLKQHLLTDKPNQATRVLSQRVLDVLVPKIPFLIGGSADLTASNNTKTNKHTTVDAIHRDGNYVNYGVREHAMAAAMNGLSLYGFRPYGGTFLVFSDYLRPSLRLSALMKQPVIYVLTHDSIGLGEDGPTHQPVEHLAALRCMPNVHVFRPADGIETAECWELALTSTETPSVLALTRQNLPTLRATADVNLTAFGGYILGDIDADRQITLIATGSEVSLAVEAQTELLTNNIRAAVVSMPCFELFDKQTEVYKQRILGKAPIIAIEAGVEFGWGKYLKATDIFIGMRDFGASAPAPILFEKFGITRQAIVSTAKRMMNV